MQNLSEQERENCPSEAHPPETLVAKIEALFASFLEKLLGFLREVVDEVVRVAVREEMQAARKQPGSGQLLTKEDVADLLQVSLRTVDTLAASGELQKIKVRGCVRFSRGAVEAYIRQRAAGEGRRR